MCVYRAPASSSGRKARHHRLADSSTPATRHEGRVAHSHDAASSASRRRGHDMAFLTSCSSFAVKAGCLFSAMARCGLPSHNTERMRMLHGYHHRRQAAMPAFADAGRCSQEARPAWRGIPPPVSALITASGRHSFSKGFFLIEVTRRVSQRNVDGLRCR